MLKETAFLRSITLDEEEIFEESPDEIRFFDLNGNEVSVDENEQAT